MWRRSRRLCLAVPAPSAALLGGLLLACAYSVLAGWGVPAQRTCLMLAAVALLRLSGAQAAVDAARRSLGGEWLDDAIAGADLVGRAPIFLYFIHRRRPGWRVRFQLFEGRDRKSVV